MSARLLMCPPNYFGIHYEINPWMSLGRPADHVRAVAQWRALYELLTGPLGAQVELMEPVEGLPDMVFTANGGFVWGDIFLRSNFRHPQRAPEAPQFAAWFAQHGYQVMELGADCPFEGEGDLFALGDNLFAGYRFRSEICSHTEIGELLERRVLSLELADPFFYHLDTCFCPLDDRSALYYPEAFDSYAQKLIVEYIPDPIPVLAEEATRFGCNAVVLGRQAVTSAGCPDLARKLEERGFTVHPLEFFEFIKAGGAAKCLVLFLSRGYLGAGAQPSPYSGADPV